MAFGSVMNSYRRASQKDKHCETVTIMLSLFGRGTFRKILSKKLGLRGKRLPRSSPPATAPTRK